MASETYAPPDPVDQLLPPEDQERACKDCWTVTAEGEFCARCGMSWYCVECIGRGEHAFQCESCPHGADVYCEDCTDRTEKALSACDLHSAEGVKAYVERFERQKEKERQRRLIIEQARGDLEYGQGVYMANKDEAIDFTRSCGASTLSIRVDSAMRKLGSLID